MSLRLLSCLVLFTVALSAVPPLAEAAKKKAYPEPVLESDQPEAKNNAVWLPVLEAGPGQGYYMYYQGDTYDAAVTKGGALLVRFKEDDEPLHDFREVHDGIYTTWSKTIGYRDNGKAIRKGFRRYIKEIDKAPKPSDKPRGKVSIEVTLMDDVEFIREFEFDDESVTVRTGFEDDDEDWPSRYRTTMRFPRCMKFDNLTPQSEREAALEGYEVTVDGIIDGDDETETYSYAKSVDMPTRVHSVEATGPWGELTVRVETDDYKLRLRKYKGTCPYEGYSVWHQVGNDTTSKRDQYEWTLTITD